ncbi:MAG: Yip1 family protein [Burkholderiales bacterium]
MIHNPGVQTLERIVDMVVRPRQAWDRIATETTSVDTLTVRFIVPLSLLAPIATGIGMRFFDSAWDDDQGYRVPAPEIFAATATTLFASIASVFALAGIFVLLGRVYGSKRDFRVALQVATYGAVPVLLAGATLVLPVMAMVVVVGFVHTLYLYWLGAKRVLEVKRNEQAEFVGISMLLFSVASTFVGAVASHLGFF